MTGINPRWFPVDVKKEAGERKEKYEQMLRGSKTALARLKEIVSEELKALESPGSTDDYANASWAYLQADRTGQIRAYRTILKLLEFIDARQPNPNGSRN